MKAVEVARANSILNAWHKLDVADAGLAAGITSAGLRCKDKSDTWLDLPVAMHGQLARLMGEHVAVERARLRRLAAQIGLEL